MTDRPIIFSDLMIRALMLGRKTQARRVLKPQPSSECFGFKKVFAVPPYFEAYDAEGDPIYAFPYPKHCVSPFPKIHIGIGDRLWVREGVALHYFEHGKHGYRADWSADAAECLPEPRWKPSIHMPRWASRLTLTVTDVRVQRLQDISESDAESEGAAGHNIYLGHNDFTTVRPSEDFASLWNDINGPDAWDANPWVVALTFDVHQQNIDHMRDAA